MDWHLTLARSEKAIDEPCFPNDGEIRFGQCKTLNAFSVR
jgi:hypothetical protein